LLAFVIWASTSSATVVVVVAELVEATASVAEPVEATASVAELVEATASVAELVEATASVAELVEATASVVELVEVTATVAELVEATSVCALDMLLPGRAPRGRAHTQVRPYNILQQNCMGAPACVPFDHRHAFSGPKGLICIIACKRSAACGKKRPRESLPERQDYW
jgi:hypothetical protein